MPELLTYLYRHTRECPFTCFLQLLCAYNFFIAIRIAASQQVDISNTLYILLLASNGVVAVLAIAMNRNCHIKSNQDHRNI